MSVGGVGSGTPQYNVPQTGGRSASAAGDAPDPSRQTVTEYGDTVEISQEARNLLENPPPSEPRKPWSIMEYETPLVSDSKEEKEFRELMKSVKSQKSNLMSRIQDIFKRHGISQKDYGKVKIEVDSSGKIVVGGVRDPKTAKAIEEALNAEKGLGNSLLKFQNDERELSRQMKAYSGCNLYELTMTQKGDVNKRIRDRVEETLQDADSPPDEYFRNLGFLGENLNHVVGSQDIAELGFQGPIDFSGETSALAEPERAIKEEMEAMYRKVQEDVEQHNEEVKKRLKAEGVDVENMSAEMKAKHFLDASGIKITVDNLGTVNVEGTFSTDEANNKKGEEIVKKRAFEMLNSTDGNSYHINVFAAASETLVKKAGDEAGGEGKINLDARVVAEIAGGVVGDIGVSSSRTEAKPRTNAPYNEAAYLRELNERLGEGINVIAGEWYDPADDAAKDAAGLPRNEREKFGAQGVSTVMIHPDFLRKMHGDPELAELYESMIRDYAESNDRSGDPLSDWLRTTSSGLYINADGETEHNGVKDAYATVASRYAKDETGAARAILGKTKVAFEELEDLRRRLHEERQSRLIDPEPPAEDEAGEENGDAFFTVAVETTLE